MVNPTGRGSSDSKINLFFVVFLISHLIITHPDDQRLNFDFKRDTHGNMQKLQISFR